MTLTKDIYGDVLKANLIKSLKSVMDSGMMRFNMKMSKVLKERERSWYGQFTKAFCVIHDTVSEIIWSGSRFIPLCCAIPLAEEDECDCPDTIAMPFIHHLKCPFITQREIEIWNYYGVKVEDETE